MPRELEAVRPDYREQPLFLLARRMADILHQHGGKERTDEEVNLMGINLISDFAYAMGCELNFKLIPRHPHEEIGDDWTELAQDLPVGERLVVLYGKIHEGDGNIVPYSVSNPEYACISARMAGWTHWKYLGEVTDERDGPDNRSGAGAEKADGGEGQP